MAKIRVGIVGLGLMGGSLSLALKKHYDDYYFIGLDHNEVHCSQALKLGLVDEITTSLDTRAHVVSCIRQSHAKGGMLKGSLVSMTKTI